MGIVYEAYDEILKRPVALKVLSRYQQLVQAPDGRFQREAELAARLSHPNIVRVFRFGTVENCQYYAMEFIEGCSLDVILRDKRLELERDDPPQRKRSYIEHWVQKFLSVAAALEEAHQKGIIHRDLKPSNLIYDRTEKLLITDFGLARDISAQTMTVPGELLGTPAYMSPEQVMAHRIPIDKRTDIYSLAATLYEVLTLDPPYHGDSVQEVLQQIALKYPPPPRSVNPAIPRDLETILMKAMARDPDQRYTSAHLFQEDLARLLEGRPILARRIGPTGRLVRLATRHPRAAIALIISLLAITTAGVWLSKVTREKLLYERAITSLEETGIRTDGSAAGTEETLRQAFFKKQLNPEHSVRVARLLLPATIEASNYISRKSQSSIRLDVGRMNNRWKTVAVIKPRTAIDSLMVASSDLLTPPLRIKRIDNELLRNLQSGKHQLNLEIDAWIFDSGEHARIFGVTDGPLRGVGVIWNPLGNMYGRNRKPWSEFWPEMQAHTPPIWSGLIRYPPREFLIVDELPSSFPLAVGSDSLNQSMADALKISEFYFQTASVCYGLTVSKVLPAPFAGFLEIETLEGTILGSARLTLGQGEGRGFSSCLDLSEKGGPLLARIRAGETIDLRARLRASKDVAVTTAGFNSYWDGILECTGKAKIYVLGKGNPGEDLPPPMRFTVSRTRR